MLIIKYTLCVYLGNSTRRDYGTGHETQFVSFIACLDRLFHFSNEDCISFANFVFYRFDLNTFDLAPVSAFRLISADTSLL